MTFEIAETIEVTNSSYSQQNFHVSWKVFGLAYRYFSIVDSLDIGMVRILRSDAIERFECVYPGERFVILDMEDK